MGEVRADAVDDVLAAIRALERARAGGLHGAGFISYEAAAAFEARFATRPAWPGLPLLWFGIYRRRVPAPPVAVGASFEVSALQPDVAEDVYAENVRRILEWIAAGDTYQVNYTFRMYADLVGSERALYAHLLRAQRAAYCAYVSFPRFSLISASPELFFPPR